MGWIVSYFSIFTFLFFSIAVAQSKTNSENSSEVQSQLMKILRERKAAFARGDRVKWKSHIADSCIWGGENVATTADVMDSFVEASEDYQSKIDMDEVQVRQYGNVAVMTCKQTDKTNRNGKKTITTYRYLDTYVLQNGEWQLVAASETFVPAEPAVAKVNPAIYDAYVGRYEFSSTMILTVTKEGDKLMAQATGQGKGEMLPENETTFFDKENYSARYIFAKNEKGVVDRMIYRVRDEDIVLKRLD